MTSGRITMHVLSHTHWDREWYQEFQGYRQRLVFQIDAMMDLFEKRPEFKWFHLDGQTSVLFDYLEIKPEGRKRLEKYVRGGQVLVGPWFVMPDERLLSGESMVRNLMLGHRHCKEFGTKPMPIGYVTDIFGHCSQFPQIVAGFGIDAVMLHRGTGILPDEKSEMVWRGADGSDVLLVSVYPWTGYQDFLTFREWTEEELKDYEKKKLALATTNVLHALDGNDHQPAKWDLTEQMERANGVFEHIECVQSSMPKYLAALRKAMGPNWKKGRKVIEGELTTPAKDGIWSETMYGFGSSRVYIKQRNDEMEYLLPRAAETFAAWARTLGHESQKGFLDLAWRYLLLNHPHDSICACSIDQVHRDMMYRFDQARLLARNSAWESIQAIGDRINTARLGGDALAVTVFNAGAAQTGPVTEVRFEVDAAAVDVKAKEGLEPALFDATGAAVPMEMLAVEKNVRAEPMTFITDSVHGLNLKPTPVYRPRTDAMDAYRAAIAATVPALGYATLSVGWRPKGERDWTLPKGVAPVVADGRILENGLIRVTVTEDGTVELFDKETRTGYKGLFVFEDVGDAGEGWNHRYPTKVTRILSSDRNTSSDVTVTVERKGCLEGALAMRLTMQVPEDLEYEREAGSGEHSKQTTTRSARTVALGIETVMTIRAGSRRVDCRTTVKNTAKCHRLRVLFPTGRNAKTWLGDSAFDVVERNVRLIDTTGWKEEAREETVIKNFAAVSDSEGGFAVLTKGLQEAAVQDNAERTLALTLFRAFRERLLHEVTEDSQLIGDVTVEYALMPFSAEEGVAALVEEADRYKVPLFSYTRPARKGTLPLDGRFVAVGKPAAVSTVKMSEDGKAVVVRVYNPTTKAASVTVKPSFAFRKATRTDFLEKAQEALKATKSGAKVRLGRKQVATVRFDLR